MKNTLLLYITLCFVLLNTKAQEGSFRQTFIEANTLMEENQYNLALKKWLLLYNLHPDNNNINFKIGKCYINSANDKKNALDYLTKAVQNTTSNYDPFSSSEKKSPVEVYYFLGRAYHINYELDEAIANYNLFKEKASKKHYLYGQIDHQIQQCENAKIAIAQPENISVENMGKNINSAYAEYSPVMSIDESTIYFTSRRIREDSTNLYLIDESDGKHFEDIYFSEYYNDEWTTPELLNINTEGHDAVVNISADGNTLFIYRDDEQDGNIYTSHLEGDNIWSMPQKIVSDINLSSRETHAHVSPDGNTLYFVSDRKKGVGGQDIYKAKKLPDGSWAKAQNMGNTINTPFDEDGIFIHPSGKIMYFSSKGHKSIGGYDIFYSTMDDAGNWTTPINMGYPVNSTDDDVFFITSADGKRGYYSSFQEQGIGEKDIYRVELESVTSAPLALLTGYMKVIGQDALPDDALVLVLENETGETIGRYTPRSRDGKFNIILSPEKNYHIIYSAGSFEKEEDLFVPSISSYKEISRAIDLGNIVFSDTTSKKLIEKPVNISNATEFKQPATLTEEKGEGEYLAQYQQFFNYSKKSINTLAKDYVKMLNKAQEKISKSDKVHIDIESSASKVPSRGYSNLKLAKMRAEDAKNTILNSLIAKGAKKAQVIINDIKSGVNGPEYKGDYKTNKIYEKYQYVIIKVK